VRTLVNRIVEQGLPPYLLKELDLVVFPRHVDGDRYVGRVVELLDESAFRELDREADTCGTIRKDGTTIYYNTVVERSHDGTFRVAYDHPQLGDDERSVGTRVFDRIAERTDRPVDAVEDEFHRKHRYVEYLEREGVTDFDDLFEFLADLRTDEAATVERASRSLSDRSGTDYEPDIEIGGTDGDD
jgi:hypothetical protein